MIGEKMARAGFSIIITSIIVIIIIIIITAGFIIGIMNDKNYDRVLIVIKDGLRQYLIQAIWRNS